MSISDFDFHKIDRAAQEYWQEQQSFVVADDENEEKFYCLSMFPYPSGQLHMGHVRNYTLGDVIARYHRLQGKQVLHPLGWDAFGLPAENAAIKHKIPPAKWTYENISNMRKQIQSLGISIDWSRELATCDPTYYHWEQWLFTRMMRKGLAYRKRAVVNWDPVDQTVLANEQVIDGKGWRSGALVEQREMYQWFLKITDYAQELLDDLDNLPAWPQQVKTMQRNWIGRSEGIEVDFQLTHTNEALRIYTTRPDTLMGVTYLAVAPAHPLAKLAAETSVEIQDFIQSCANVKVAEAEMATIDKAGVATPFFAKHPLTGKDIPIWIANFVLMDYGTGAVMAVPAHDQRDWEFAKQYPSLEILQVISDTADENPALVENAAYTEKGILVNSGKYSSLTSAEAFKVILDDLVGENKGKKCINYRLRDWGISRQRYWGCPIPVIHCDACGAQPVPDDQLPVELPTDVSFDGVASPLNDIASFYSVKCPSCQGDARRETDTFDTFFESSWYFLRFASSPSDAMLDERVNRWMSVDHYVGGIEHAVLHLLYARFFHKVVRDEGLLEVSEPFKQLLMLGMVLKDGKKMSKSSGIGKESDPAALLDDYGADAVRLAMIFSAPPDQSVEWSSGLIEGSAKFLKKLWKAVHVNGTLGKDVELNEAIDDDAKKLRRLAHETLKKADIDYGRRIHFNTVVSGAMALFNATVKLRASKPQGNNVMVDAVVFEAFAFLLIMLSPIVPHITHVLWFVLGHDISIDRALWPQVDEALLNEKQFIEMVVQVKGKVRGRLQTDPSSSQEAICEAALSLEPVKAAIGGKSIKKSIYVPGKLINFVV